jgi:hypothetical protein
MQSDATRTPSMAKVLGEELVLFRGTSLSFSRTEERGIRCCYHGVFFGDGDAVMVLEAGNFIE